MGAARVRDEARVRLHFADSVVPHVPQGKQALLPPAEIRRRGAITREILAGGVAEIALAVLAVADAVTSPAVRKDTVDRIHADDLAGDVGHEVEGVWTKCAGEP